MNAPAEPTPAQQNAARLTAWAVDELTADAQAEFAASLSGDPVREAEAEATKTFCRMLQSELPPAGSMSALQLNAEARSGLAMAAKTRKSRSPLIWALPLGAAACAALMISGYQVAKEKSAARRKLASAGSQGVAVSPPAPPPLTIKEVGVPETPEVPPQVADHGPTQEVSRLFRMGAGYLDLGQFKEAEHQFNEVLALNPSHAAARRGLEITEREMNNYHRAARDHTRAKMLSEVDRLGVTPVPGMEPQASRAPYGFASGLENPFLPVLDQPLSTFSIDVDTASYAIARRHLNEGQRPPVESVRLEEMINYFPMDDAPPADGKPFAVHVETASAPWAPKHRLVRVALKGKVPAAEARRPANLVFLVDTSGSMGQPNKLQLVQQSLRLLLDQLEPRDLVTLVTYAGDSELKLPATPVSERARIATAIDALTSGGSTNGSGGITTAYQQARTHLVEGGVNRVILATDGDFNVGLTRETDLQTLIAKEAKSGVYLSVLAYGSDNLKDTTAELLADQGNGNYAYIDSLSEARRALVTQLQGTLVTIAKDVKIQVEFNPAQVAQYRLLGYENRALANQDFNDDTKDAGEIGAGHSVTALYEIIPAGAPDAVISTGVDPLKYQSLGPPDGSPANPSDDIKLAFVNVPLEDVLEEYERLSNRHILRDASIAANVTVVQPKDSKFNAAEAAAYIKETLMAQDLRIWEYRPGIDKVTFNPAANRGELLTVKLRYQPPEGTAPSQLIEVPVKDPGTPWTQASANFRWTAAVAGYGMLLRDSAHAGDLTWETVRPLATAAKGPDPDGFRGEFLQLIEKAASLVVGDKKDQ